MRHKASKQAMRSVVVTEVGHQGGKSEALHRETVLLDGRVKFGAGQSGAPTPRRVTVPNDYLERVQR